MVDTSTSPAKGYMELVPNRQAATLLPILNAHVAPGTIIHSDQWNSYSQVGTLSNVSSHATVNHSLHFVDPSTGVQTQNVESYWATTKRKLKNMKGCHAHSSQATLMKECGERDLELMALQHSQESVSTLLTNIPFLVSSDKSIRLHGLITYKFFCSHLISTFLQLINCMLITPGSVSIPFIFIISPEQ